MRKRVILPVLAFSVIIMTLVLYGCGRTLEITDADAERVLKELVPRSYEINEIFFGEGLRAEEEAYTETHDKAAYYPVSDAAVYKTVKEIKNAAEEVYCGKYLSEIYVAAFEGTHTEGNEGGLDSSYSARYREINGRLCVNVAVKSLSIRGKMDVLSAKVTEKTGEYVKCESKVLYGDGTEGTEYFYLTCEDDIWLLYSPTY